MSPQAMPRPSAAQWHIPQAAHHRALEFAPRRENLPGQPGVWSRAEQGLNSRAVRHGLGWSQMSWMAEQRMFSAARDKPFPIARAEREEPIG